MRLVPVLRRLGIDLQGHRELQIGMRRIGHHFAHHFDRRLDLGVRRFEYEFVMDLQQHVCRKLCVGQRRVHAHHRAADDVGGRTLDRRVDRGAFVKSALRGI